MTFCTVLTLNLSGVQLVHSGDKMSSGGRVVASRYDRSESSWLVAGLAERHISPHLLGHDGPLLGSHFSTID
jgi:hypothetical protein